MFAKIIVDEKFSLDPSRYVVFEWVSCFWVTCRSVVCYLGRPALQDLYVSTVDNRIMLQLNYHI